jgi:alkanesulfonate monooxygenase SsuD/methylene tetrahydromethanopterin reductase-like flavin-dependent oxidoreductase (luciferase family)
LGSGWIGGAASPADVAKTIGMIKDELEQCGRSIDEDHYGASIAFRIGSPDDDAVRNSPLLQRTGIGDEIDLNSLFCVGDAEKLTKRLQDYVAVGASKFVLFPVSAGDTDTFDQTRRVIEEVKPLIED